MAERWYLAIHVVCNFMFRSFYRGLAQRKWSNKGQSWSAEWEGPSLLLSLLYPKGLKHSFSSLKHINLSGDDGNVTTLFFSFIKLLFEIIVQDHGTFI